MDLKCAEDGPSYGRPEEVICIEGQRRLIQPHSAVTVNQKQSVALRRGLTIQNGSEAAAVCGDGWADSRSKTGSEARLI